MSAPSLTVTTREDGIVRISRSTGGGWSPFVPINELGRGNINTSFSLGDDPGKFRVCAVDDTLSNQLRFTQSTTGTTFSRPLALATGVGLANIMAMGRSSTDILALGAPTNPGWSFGLPYFVIDAAGATFRDLGDQTGRLLRGPLAEDDPPVALDVWGFPSELRLCLATESGGLYFADASSTGTSTFEDVKTTGAGDPGKVISLSVCRGSDVLHLCVVNDAGKILHTMRRRNSSGTWLPWLPWGDVNAALRTNQTFSQVSAGYFGTFRVMHLAAVTPSGGLFYSNRSAEGWPTPIWAPLVNVKATAGDPGTVISADVDSVWSVPG